MKKQTPLQGALFGAFTLAELLMATLVISIIMVALAPVITRRAHDNVAITVNQKQGLEIFATPGIYSFDVPVGINTLFLQGSGGGGGGAGATYIEKSLTFNSGTTWKVPKGVNQITFTLQGGGGGGAGGYGKQGDETCPSPFIRLPEMADDGRDLCYFSKGYDNVLGFGHHNGVYVAEPSTQVIATVGSTCFRYNNKLNIGRPVNVIAGSISPAIRLACNAVGASQYCGCYLPLALDWHPPCSAHDPALRVHDTYLIKASEMQRVLAASPAPNYKYLTPQYMDVYVYPDASTTTKVSATTWTMNCPSIDNSGYCYVNNYPLSGGYLVWRVDKDYNGNFKTNNGEPYVYSGSSTRDSGTPFCVYAIKDWYPYGGSGGGSGSKLTHTIKVLPGDDLVITIGDGGSGGNTGSNGNIGNATQIVHKRNGSTLATYYANGGYGGNKATTSGAGAATLATNRGCSSGGSCTTVVSSPAGSAGGTGAGGNGSGGVSGGTPDKLPTAGSANSSYGGGGGFCPRSARTASSCQKGADGGSGKAIINYRVNLPGAGGGSATRVGGSTTVSGEDKKYEIKYKVQEGSRLVIKIGAGGSGGGVGQDGTNGEPTIVGDNKILFLGGQGARAITQTQKNNLSSCIGSTTNSTTIQNCINNTSYKSTGGQSGVINDNDTAQSTTLGLVINDSSNTSYTVSSTSFKGQAGKIPNYYSTESSIPLKYGFDGGVGGSPFGIYQTAIKNSVTCGGGMTVNYPTSGITAGNYICTSGSINAIRAKVHDPVNNEFGGSGGGGGGVIDTSLDLGEGSGGTSGYLRVRWNEAEQE